MRVIVSLASAIGLLFAFLWPRYLYVNVGGKGVGGYVVMTAALLVVALLVFLFSPDRQTKALAGFARGGIVLFAFVAFYGWRLIADSASPSGGDALGLTWQEIVTTGGWLFIAAILYTDTTARRAVPLLISLCAIIASGFGLLEFVQQRPIFEIFNFSAFANMDPQLIEVLQHGSSLEGQYRIKSIFNHPILYGQIMALTIPFALHFILHRGFFYKLMAIVQLIAIIFSILVCESRSPLIIVVVSAISYLAVYYFDIRRARRLVVFAAMTVIMIIATPTLISKAINLTVGESARDARSAQTRVVQLQRGQFALNVRPIFGYGNGTALQYGGVQNSTSKLVTIDNYYLSIAIECGYVGLILFMFMMISFAIFGISTATRESETLQRSALAAMVGLIVGCFPAISIVSIPDTLTFVYLAIGYCLADSGSSIINARRDARSAAAL